MKTGLKLHQQRSSAVSAAMHKISIFTRNSREHLMCDLLYDNTAGGQVNNTSEGSRTADTHTLYDIYIYNI